MKIQVLFFASIKEFVRVNNIEISNCSTLSELKSKLIQDFPGIEHHTFAFAVNNQIQNNEMALKNGDVVALLPPFSGG